MALPSLPTDNLYKFIAISGLTLLIAPSFIVFSEVRALETRAFEVWRNHANFEAQADAFETRVNAITTEDDTLRALGRSNVAASEVERLIDDMRKVRVDGEAIKALGPQLRADQHEMKVRIDGVESARRIAAWASAAGAVLAIVGFRLWYLRLQRYADGDARESSLGRARKRR